MALFLLNWAKTEMKNGCAQWIGLAMNLNAEYSVNSNKIILMDAMHSVKVDSAFPLQHQGFIGNTLYPWLYLPHLSD